MQQQGVNMGINRAHKTAPVRAVIFDLDDTLWPLLPLITRAEQTLFDWLQQHVPAVTRQHSIQSLRAVRAELLPTNARFEYDLWALRKAVLTRVFTLAGEDLTMIDPAMQIFSHARNQVSLFPDALPVLTQLGKNFRLGSISNGFADLAAIGLAEHFGVSLAAHQFGCAKPDARIFLAACAALEVEPHQAVYVGDDVLIDVQGAQQAGLRTVWINRSGKVAPPDLQPDAECRDLSAVLHWLHQHHTTTSP